MLLLLILFCIIILGVFAFIGAIVFIALYAICSFLIMTCWIWAPLLIIGYIGFKLIKKK